MLTIHHTLTEGTRIEGELDKAKCDARRTERKEGSGQ